MKYPILPVIQNEKNSTNILFAAFERVLVFQKLQYFIFAGV